MFRILVIIFVFVSTTLSFAQVEDTTNKPIMVKPKLDEIPVDNSVPSKDPAVDRYAAGQSQSNSKDDHIPFLKKLRFGGGLTGGFSNGYSYLGIYPQVTTMVTENLEAGMSVGYTYQGNFSQVSYHNFYAGPIARYYLFDRFFAQVEGYMYYFDYHYYGATYTKTLPNAFVGGGIVQPLGPSAALIMGLKINLIKNEISNNQTQIYPFMTFSFGGIPFNYQ